MVHGRKDKVFKLFPEKFLTGYDYTLWVDAARTPKINVRYLIKKYLRHSSFAVFAHPHRFCIYDEADACIVLGKDTAERIRPQLALYRAQGYPRQNGLIYGGVILRRSGDPQVQAIAEAWWQEITNHSIRDQLSFNYVAWKHHFSYTVIPGDIDRVGRAFLGFPNS